ncbi:BTAD domain-containing putative transcriptional regulator [Amycolatopsis sp. NPDC059657]|uniref:BTAD domain-containing putative transcriptional regulator n=1 Tax=Amycolatopsis sp. NPDC059657 TaxID=3346899 RepID=UPI00366DB727
MRIIRIFATAAVLALVLAAPPAVLWTTRSTFLPDHIPNAAELAGRLTDRDTGHVFLAVLVLAGLLAWLQLVIAFAVEIIARARGVRAPRLPGFGWAQRLVAAVLLGLLAGTATAAADSGQESAESVVSTPFVASDIPAPAPPSESQPTHTVVPGDSLMRIAADRLGDENRFREIFELNKSRRQADGGLLRDLGLLKPGWILVLPADGDRSPCGEVTVRIGDTLSKIARDHLGDSRRYQEIFTLNKDRPQPGGHPLTDPDRIYPGAVVRLPTAARPAGGGSAPQSSSIARSVDGPKPVAPNCAPPAQPVDERPPTDPASPAFPPSSTPAPPVATPSTSGVEPAAADDGVSTSVIMVGGLLAAGILATLGTRRMLAQRRRRPGHRIPHPETLGDAETALRIAEQPEIAQLLNTSLRTLAHHAHEDSHELPVIRSAIAGPAGLTLHPQHPARPPAPFKAQRRSRDAWTLDPAAALLKPEQVRATPAPYPALITLGHTRDRDLVLVNLEHAGAIVLRGDGADVDAVLLAMAWELSASPWADHIVVTLVGVGQTTAAHNPDRLRYAATVDDALDAFERRAHDVAQGLRDAGVDSVTQARGTNRAEDTWTPDIILSACPFSRSQQDRLFALIATGGPVKSLAAIITAADDAHPLTGAWELDLSTNPTPVEALGLDVELQRLTPAHVNELVAALAAADNAVQAPAEEYRNVPTEPEDIPEPLNTDELLVAETTAPECDTADWPDPVVPLIQVLGSVGLKNVDVTTVEARKVNRLTELAVFLALHPGATADEISRQLGTGAQPWSQATRQGYISRLRTWLGRDLDGELYVPNNDSKHGGYRLSEAIQCDWLHFQQLAHRGLNGDPARRLANLERALDLVDGVPLSNVPHGRYTWSSWLQRDMTDAIVDVAHTVADIQQQAGNLRAARHALGQGLRAEPVSEILYRDFLRVEHRAGNHNVVREMADKLAELSETLDVDLEPETSELIRRLLESHVQAQVVPQAEESTELIESTRRL